MSAKGRGRHEGGDFDYYPTPAWCVHRLLDDCGAELLRCAEALEPTAGDGAIVRAVGSWPTERSKPYWSVCEIRRGAFQHWPDDRVHTIWDGYDFCAGAWGRYDLALGNPPFNAAEKVIRKCLAHAGVVAMLLRVGFLGSDERVDFFRGVGANPALRILPDRPSFDGVGTDASTYAWFVWGHPEITGVKMLGSTPLAVRKAQTPQGMSYEAAQVPLFGKSD